MERDSDLDRSRRGEQDPDTDINFFEEREEEVDMCRPLWRDRERERDVGM
jgi:hypothetical protein